MTKEEFIKDLRESLYTEIPSIEIESNIRYYSEYIDSQMSNGKTMDEVMSELGDPRLIARTIIETSKLSGSNKGHSKVYQDEYRTADDDAYTNNEQGNARTYNFDGKIPLRHRISGTVILILILMLIFLVGSIAIRLFFSIGLPLLLVYLLIRIVTKK
ncbi:DUF1700 domain-containing protein [Anaerosporobacter sp.]|uniref:DUF1700 domain-containing protein n=1 Tax=Anaerosporobacter sp. TaxID=1872529 RepID=UPI00286EE74F|nr:DUF1700 domain-containing protein [Anaerosporobacter sp.]